MYGFFSLVLASDLANTSERSHNARMSFSISTKEKAPVPVSATAVGSAGWLGSLMVAGLGENGAFYRVAEVGATCQLALRVGGRDSVYGANGDTLVNGKALLGAFLDTNASPIEAFLCASASASASPTLSRLPTRKARRQAAPTDGGFVFRWRGLAFDWAVDDDVLGVLGDPER